MLGDGEHQHRVKVLDFGLAKLAGAAVEPAGMSLMPTAPVTGGGRILSTVAYMSPEQAEGKAIDSRSDPFSLGIILYEMATGQRPFTRRDEPLDHGVDREGHADVRYGAERR